ncbi:MAG TPA: alkaline phosphatase family protein [Candidatus Angelobacter sp.]
MKKLWFAIIALTLWFELGCGGVQSTKVNDPPVSPSPTQTSVPHIGHIALIIFENQEEDGILGNPNMAFLTSLARQNAYAAQYFADVHPSLGNYFTLTTGQIISNDLNFAGVVDVDNLVREIIKAGKTWKAYEEDIPATGYLDDGPYPYIKTHDPAAYLSDVRNNPAQAANLVSLDQLQADLASHNLPNFMFVEPNQINSMHDCPGGGQGCPNDVALHGGDVWAQNHIPAIINNPVFQQDGLLIITWDESWDIDFQHGGGHVLTIMVGPKVKPQFVSNTFYQHESVLRTICDALGIPSMGNAASAPPMADFFVGH